MATISDWYRKLHEYETCEGFEIQGRLLLFQIPLETFHINCDDLLAALDAIIPTEEPGAETIFEFSDWVRPMVSRIVRLVHNFVASAMTLVEQSRVLYTHLYEVPGLIPDYPAEVKAQFGQDGLHPFIQGLRNMTVHYQLPPVFYTERRNISVDGSTICHEVHFSKRNLLKWGGWNTSGLKFIREAPTPFEIAPVVRSYLARVNDFHDWYAGRRRDAHKEQLGEVERLEAVLRAIACELRDKGEGISWPGEI